jgi:hypothetical protein
MIDRDTSGSISGVHYEYLHYKITKSRNDLVGIWEELKIDGMGIISSDIKNIEKWKDYGIYLTPEQQEKVREYSPSYDDATPTTSLESSPPNSSGGSRKRKQSSKKRKRKTKKRKQSSRKRKRSVRRRR